MPNLHVDNFRVANPTLVGTLGDWGEMFKADICRDPLPDGHFDWIIHAAGIASPTTIEPTLWRRSRSQPLALSACSSARSRRMQNFCISHRVKFTAIQIQPMYRLWRAIEATSRRLVQGPVMTRENALERRIATSTMTTMVSIPTSSDLSIYTDQGCKSPTIASCPTLRRRSQLKSH